MKRKTGPTPDSELLDLLPETVRKLALGSRKTIETEHGEWLVEVERPPKEIARFLPAEAIVIANNGYGDFLFLEPLSDTSRQLSPVTHVYWHEGPQVEILSPDIGLLAYRPQVPSPPAAKPSYADGSPVLPGDHVELRVWVRLFRKVAGTVVYVPGISKRRPQLEHSGLSWVGIRLDDSGTVVGSWVEPDTKRLQKGVKLLGRGEPQELQADVKLEG
jgi:hypothetical protein